MKFQLESSKPRIFPSTSSPSTGWKFSFWVLSEEAVNATCPSITLTAASPRRILLLALTVAPLPIAVALVRFPSDTLAPFPMAVLKLPVVLLKKRIESDAGVGDPRGVVLKRECPKTGVALSRSNPARDSEKMSAISTEKNQAVLLEWLNIIAAE